MSFPSGLLNKQDIALKPAPELSQRQLADIATMEAHFNDKAFTLPTEEGGNTRAPLTEREFMYLSRETLFRFLSATRNNVPGAINRLERAVTWRRTVRIEDWEAMAADVEAESSLGKNIVQGFTPHGQPIMYCFPNRNSLPVEKRRPIHPVFMTERCLDLATDGVTTLYVVFSFHGKRQGQPSSITQAHKTLYIFSEYYPEVMGTALVQEMPWMVKTFVNIMWPFLDHHTRSKIKMNNGAQAVAEGELSADELLVECGGNLNLPYNHDAYWSQFMDTVRERRAYHEERFRALGPARAGRQERHFKLSPGSLSEKSSQETLVGDGVSSKTGAGLANGIPSGTPISAH